MYKPVVLKRVPLCSPREELLIPGRFVPGKNWGEKAVDEENLNVHCLIQHTKTVQ